MKTKLLVLCMATFTLISCKNENKDNTTDEKEIVEETTSNLMDDLTINPITHATMVLEWKDKVIYVDPVGGKEAFEGMKSPDIILVTDIHGDHLNAETIAGILNENTKIIAPKAVIEKLPKTMERNMILLANEQMKTVEGFDITGVAMYNLREEALQYHEKGRGNGYLLEKDGHRVYISGDTEDIPEMRSLKNIDLAFVCMNLPYTMTVGSAADAVIAFQPSIVVPYHFKGMDGLSDVDAFEATVNEAAPNVEVLRLEWYPSN